MFRFLSPRRLAVAPLAVALALLAAPSRLDGQQPPMGPRVTIDLPQTAPGGYAFKGSVITVGWTAGANANVQVTNKAGGTLIPSTFGPVNATQTAWGPSGVVALDKGQYFATVQLNFTHPTLGTSKQTAVVEFEIK
jgi:hypothetical protein